MQATQPEDGLRRELPRLLQQVRGRVVVVGAGKASSQMARALERLWPDNASPLQGVVVTRYGYAVPCERIRVMEAAHPVPDEGSVLAANQVIQAVSSLSPEDLVICLLSGGGSSLLSAPPPGISLRDKQVLNEQLLRCGASIHEMNIVRRHVSEVKGGRLASACLPARLVTLAISDVAGDSPSDIASGPTAPDVSTREDALRVIREFRLDLPDTLLNWLESPQSESVKPNDPTFDGERLSEYRVVVSPRIALDAAALLARERSVEPLILSDCLEGDTHDLAELHAKVVREVTKPTVILSGGEASVKVTGSGIGGRNVQFLAELAVALNGHPTVYALSADTDGVDGMVEIAGAFIDPSTLERVRSHGFSMTRILSDNDAHTLFQTIGDSLITGPTGTNVNDFRAIYVGAT